jgi:hypothetical protein
MQVSDVKAEIEKGQGSAYPANGQVIIFQGKVSCLCCIVPACAVVYALVSAAAGQPLGCS